MVNSLSKRYFPLSLITVQTPKSFIQIWSLPIIFKEKQGENEDTHTHGRDTCIPLHTCSQYKANIKE